MASYWLYRWFWALSAIWGPFSSGPPRPSPPPTSGIISPALDVLCQLVANWMVPEGFLAWQVVKCQQTSVCEELIQNWFQLEPNYSILSEYHLE